jgi:amino acid adenylation domain-containing protein
MYQEIDNNLLLLSSKFVKQKQYWLKKLTILTEDMKNGLKESGKTSLYLSSTLVENKKTLTTVGNRVRQEIPLSEDSCRQLIRLAKGSDTSIYIILTALLKALIFRYTGREAISIISPVYKEFAGRDTLNTFLVLSDRVSADLSIKELILAVKQTVLEAYKNQDYPLDILIESLVDSTPKSGGRDVKMSDIACSLDTLHDIEPEKGFSGRNQAQQDLIFAFERKDEGLAGNIWYTSGIYEPGAIEQIAHHFNGLLENALKDMQTKISEILYLSQSEIEQLLHGFNDTAEDYNKSDTFPALFQRQVEQAPDRIALVSRDHHISYHDLNRLSHRLAHRFIEKGVKPGEIVGLLTNPGIDMMVGILGVLMSGCAYLPMDPWWPENRIDGIIADSGISCIAIGEGVSTAIPPAKVVEIAETSGRAMETIEKKSARKTNIHIQVNDLAYVIYTSGSTGKPKGVMIDHGNVTAYLNAFLREFDIDSDDVIVQQASYSFDAFVEEIYPLLVKGGKIVIPSHHQGKDAGQLSQMAIREGATILNCTPLLLNELNKGERLETVRIVISGGDVLKEEYVSRFLKTGGVYNTYGPTESTVCATYYRCPDSQTGRSAVPIGTPIANYRVYILDKNGQPLPTGLPGEICISGDGVARGYLNKPQLTLEKFVVPPPSSLIPGRYYRSGDLGRRMPDGNIEFIGRVDHQVKVRGYRIELGEIENSLAAHGNIDETTVITRDNKFGEKYICAYFTAGRKMTVKELREFLSTLLPDYMIPVHFIQLDTIPVTFTGKVDINALPLPGHFGPGADRHGTQPANELELKLAHIWCDALGIKITGTGADFFELGGDSLAANRVIARVRKELQVEVPLRSFFEQPTIKGLAAEVSGRKKELTVIGKAPRDIDIPLSFSQERLWFLAQLNHKNMAYFVPRVLHLKGEIRVSLFERVFTEILRRHEILRTVFDVVNGRPVQRVRPPYEMKIPVHDLSRFEGESQREKIGQVVLEEGQKKFDFFKGPLIRLNIMKLKEDEHLLMSTEHHLIHDGWTQGVLLREFISIYEAYSQEKSSPLLELPIQYADYASWQRRYMQGEVLEHHQDYWKQKLAGVPAVTELPQDRPRPAEISGNGSIIQFTLPATLHKDLKEFSRKHDATLFMTMLAVFKSMLLRYSGKGDITIGTGIANRKYKEMEGMLGMVINTVALRTVISENLPFSLCLNRVKSTCLEAYEHEDTPFEKVVEAVQPERSLSYNPIFQVLYSFMDTPTEQLRLPGLEVGVEESHNRSSKFDINIVVILPEDGGEGDILVDWEYNTDLFDDDTIYRLIRHYENLLTEVINHFQTPLSKLPMLDPAEKERLLYGFNDTYVDYPSGKTIQTLFEEQVERTPDHFSLTGITIAEREREVAGGEKKRRTLSYKELNLESNRLAHRLQIEGIKSGDIVGLMVDRSVEMVIAQLAILKAGAVYLPIGAEYPGDRVRYMLNDSCAKLLITGGDTIDVPGIATLNTALLELDDREETAINPTMQTGPQDLLYVIYTSGTTGRPKGIMIQNRSMVNFIKGLTDIIPFTETDSILSLTTISFDIYGLESLLPLTKGTRVVMGTAAEQVDPALAAETMARENISIFQATPSRLQLLLMAGEAVESLKPLKSLLVGGEAFPAMLLDRVRTLTDGRIYNVYGPAETTIWSTVKDLTGDVPLDIGSPIANTFIYILGPSDALQPVGAVGELCISGDGVARGYINRPELTMQKFIPDPWVEGYWIYRTGDLAKWLPDGNIEFIGRKDFQVKIRGFRIELPEIEKQLQTHPDIEDAVTIVKEKAGDKFLCAYVVSHSLQEIDANDMREYLAQKLPNYMIPAYFVQLEALPLNPNGKVDRKQLPEPELKIVGQYLEPQTGTEKILVSIWEGILDLDRQKIGANANFFALGGHSLKASLVISRIHKELNVSVPLAQMFKTQTVSGLAQYIDTLEEDGFVSIHPVEKREYYALSSAQKRLHLLQQMDLKNTAYNISGTVYFNEPLDTEQLHRSFYALIARHESFRTSFVRVDGEPCQVIHETAHFELEHFEAAGEAEVDQITASFIRPFDLQQAPLLRAGFIRTPQFHILLVDMHHIISDGVSIRLLQQEFNQIYNGTQLPPLVVHYKDYAAWQNESILQEKMNTQEAYWLNQFRNSGELPVIDLPTDHIRPAVRNFQGNIIGFALTTAESEIIRNLARQTNATVFMVILAMYNVLISKLSGLEDVIIGTAIASRRHEDLQKIVGMFANTLALRNFPKGEITFNQFLEEVKNNCLDAFENQEYQFEELVDKLSLQRRLDRNPLFDVGLTIFERDEYVGDRFDLDDEDVHQNKKGISKFDLVLLVKDAGENFHFNFEYSTALFESQTIERFIAYFRGIIAQVSADSLESLASIKILSEAEREQVLFDFNSTTVPYPKDKTIQELFEAQVRKKPSAIALVFGDQQVTYKELNRNVNQLASQLRAKGVGPGSIAGIMVKRSIQMIIGILGILKTGAAFTPIDLDAPRNRILSLLDDCNASLLITDEDVIREHSFSILQRRKIEIVTPAPTVVRPQIRDLDFLPVPDRSLINYELYNHYIGEAMVKNSMSLQATRGCPYLCAYCHKIWPKTHVYRSAEHIFQEVHRYYKMGVRRFAFIDDIFNLNIKNSMKFFQMVIDNGLDIQIFFPNGVRGDILTEEYMDAMVAAGTVNVAFALETASPRLQKLIGKNLKLDKFKHNIQYMCEKHPQVMLEMFTMHGFPSETEEEAMMTLNFIKSLKWLDIPYVLILKVYPNTDMEKLALENGVSAEAIKESENFAYQELPDTLPFKKSFTRKYQSDFFDNYFLNRERLLSVLPNQLKYFTPDEILKKHNNFIPNKAEDFAGLLSFFGISQHELKLDDQITEEEMYVPDLNTKLNASFPTQSPAPDALNVLILDLSQVFKKDDPFFDNMAEPPLGPMYILTYLKEKLGNKINGKIAKSGIEFDDYDRLIEMLDEFKPDIIGIRTLTNTKDFFHRSVSVIKQWRPDIPIIAGGPYATSGYKSLLQDKNIDLVVLGEGEITFCQFIEAFIANDNILPDEEELRNIPGIAFVPGQEKESKPFAREILLLDDVLQPSTAVPLDNPEPVNHPEDLAYAMFTSGTTGQPKAVLVEHRNIVRLVKNTNFMAFQEGDHILQTAPLEFDASTFEIWGSLLNGLRLTLSSKKDILDPESLKQHVRQHHIVTMWMTSPLFNHMFDIDPSIFAGLKHIIIGGDVLSPAHIDKLRKMYPELTVSNGYGPTENTTFSTTYRIRGNHSDNIPIGKPIANSTAYILNRYCNPVPLGVVGELYVGGDGVSRGYLNNPVLTHQKYISNPWLKGDRLYRTGDNARWLPDGNIEFLGRMDQQVKIRGIRIELEEIENRLMDLEEIKEAVVLAREDNWGQKNICAYIVTGKRNLDFEPLKKKLSSVLPDYMIPSHFVQMENIPLTANGKVDKTSLPRPEIASGDCFLLPRTTTEEKLVDIWANVLSMDKKLVSIQANFFELGGQSLKAGILVSRIKRDLNAKIELVDIFENQTVEELARCIEKSDNSLSYPVIQPAQPGDYYECSPAQLRLYVMHQMNSADIVYNIPMVFSMASEPDMKKLAQSFSRLIKRHDSLRTSFETRDEVPVQIIHKDIDFEIECYDSHEPFHDTANPETKMEPMIKKFVRPFDLSQAPLLRVGLIRAGLTHILMIDMHHIIADGGCYSIMQQEFLALYEGKELPESKLQYKDFVAWQNSPAQRKEINKQKEYWLDIYSDDVPVLQLPTDFDRPDVPDFEGNTLRFNIESAQTEAIKEWTRLEDVTLFMFLLAVNSLWLSKLSGQEDIVVGSAASGREHPDLQSIIGMFVNMLAIRNYPQDHKIFNEYVREVKESVIKGFENQGYPFDDLVDQVVKNRDTSRRPLFDVVFAMQNSAPDETRQKQQTNLNLEHYQYKDQIAKYDLTMVAHENGDTLSFQVEYSSRLFKEETILRFIDYFKDILAMVLENKSIQLADIKISHSLEDSDSETFKTNLGFLDIG